MYARGAEMKIKSDDAKEEKNERVSFFELLNLIDFRDDLKYK